jgi:hypothetical protein
MSGGATATDAHLKMKLPCLEGAPLRIGNAYTLAFAEVYCEGTG